MANTRELRRRIKSVKNTSQITKAMQMVAATKMKRAQDQAFSSRPYFETLNFSLSVLLPKINTALNTLLSSNTSKKIGIVLLSTDKSLCGALNTNLFRFVQNFSHESQYTNHDTLFYTIGKKGRDFVVKTGRELAADFENNETATFRQATQVSKILIEAFLKDEIGEAYVVYPDFISALRQEPKAVKLLPIDIEAITALLKEEQRATSNDQKEEFLFEPNIPELLEYILIHSLEVKIYQAMLETKASEHSARMIAMQNATENAKELVGDLQLTYNQTRQDAITRELLEITSALAALE